ncbi:MAG: OmpH family outer membrane protein [Asticcacaulis sp.]
MKKHILITAGLSALMATAALAQQPAAPAAAPAQPPALKSGPPIAGLCLYSRDAVMANAAVAKATAQRLDQISQQAEAELEPESQALEKESTTLAAQEKTMAKDKFEPLAKAFVAKVKAYQDKAFIVGQELAGTERQANVLLAQAVQPAVQAVYEAKSCGLLVDRQAVLAANPAMDITGAVIDKLDTAKTAIDVKRVVFSEADRQKLLKAKAERDAQQQQGG